MCYLPIEYLKRFTSPFGAGRGNREEGTEKRISPEARFKAELRSGTRFAPCGRKNPYFPRQVKTPSLVGGLVFPVARCLFPIPFD